MPAALKTLKLSLDAEEKEYLRKAGIKRVKSIRCLSTIWQAC